MNTRLVYLAASLALLEPVIAQDKIQLPKLLNYTDVTITKVEADGVRIMHSSGLAKVPFESLPDELKAKLGFDPKAAEAHRAQQAADKAAKAEQSAHLKFLEQNCLYFTADVFQVADKGVLLKLVEYTDGTKEETKVPYQVQVSGPNALHPETPVTYETRYNTKWVTKVRSFGGSIIHVDCDTAGIADGDKFSKAVYPNGTYSYTNVQGAKKTVPSYTTDAIKFLRANGRIK